MFVRTSIATLTIPPVWPKLQEIRNVWTATLRTKPIAHQDQLFNNAICLAHSIGVIAVAFNPSLPGCENVCIMERRDQSERRHVRTKTESFLSKPVDYLLESSSSGVQNGTKNSSRSLDSSRCRIRIASQSNSVSCGNAPEEVATAKPPVAYDLGWIIGRSHREEMRVV
jgi:hypothetical protein